MRKTADGGRAAGLRAGAFAVVLAAPLLHGSTCSVAITSCTGSCDPCLASCPCHNPPCQHPLLFDPSELVLDGSPEHWVDQGDGSAFRVVGPLAGFGPARGLAAPERADLVRYAEALVAANQGRYGDARAWRAVSVERHRAGTLVSLERADGALAVFGYDGAGSLLEIDEHPAPR